MSPEPTPAALRELDAIDAALDGRPVEADLADVAELARALRAERPVPSERFSRELDERAAAGWRGSRPARSPARPRRRPLSALLRPQLGLAVAAVAALGLGIAVLPKGGPSDDGAGGSGASGGAASSEEAAMPASRAESDSASGAAGEDALRESSASGGAEPVRRASPRLKAPPAAAPGQPGGRAGNRSVERSAAMTLAMPPDELEGVAAGVARVAERANGYVAESSVTADPEGGSAGFTLRVPTDRLTAVLSDLSKLADVRTRSQTSDDITAAVASTSERVADLRAERRGLRRRLARTGDPVIRDRLRYVTDALARARGDLAAVRRRANLATVLVTLNGDPASKGAAAPDDGRWGPGDALGDAGRILEWVAGAALVALAAALPLLLLGLPLLLAGRWRRTRLREQALDAV